MKPELKKIERISKALGDSYRLQMLLAIKKGPNWMQCSALTEMFELAQSTVSHHLTQLTDAELIIVEKDGRATKYRVNEEVLSAYIEFLDRLR